MREMTQETDQAKKQIDEKENEVRNLNKQMQSMTQVSPFSILKLFLLKIPVFVEQFYPLLIFFSRL